MNSKSPKLKKLKFFQIFLLLTFSIIKYSSSLEEEEECPRDKPIKKSTECQSTYCTPEEYAQNICKIANKYIKTQWLNNLHMFDELHMSHISVSKSPKGDLFLSSHKITDDFDKYIFGFNSEGDGLFYNEKTDSYTSFEIIDFRQGEYADYNNYVEIDGKGYLLGVPTDDDIYLIDYENKTHQYFTVSPKAVSSDTIFKINEEKDIFFTAYLFCKDTFKKDCFLQFLSFKFKSQSIEKVNNITNVPSLTGTRINCFQNEKGIIFCFYTKNEGTNLNPLLTHYIGLIDPKTFVFNDIKKIKEEFLTTPIFDETIQLREDLYILAYALDDQVIKLEFKKISISEMESGVMLNYNDFFQNITEILINEDKKFNFKSGTYRRNDLYRINDNKFAMLLKDFSKDTSTSFNSILQIYIFTIYNNDQNINIRRYSIDFELYNTYGSDDIRGYTLGNFFGVILGLTFNRQTTSNSRATFMTFGYVNSTEQEMYDTNLKYNDTNSKIILREYINEIENNIFGYEFIGVKIISLPNEEESGYFINNITNEKIQKDNIIDINSELKFILSKNYKPGIYSIVFAGVVSEPSYEIMNEYAEELIEYPLNEGVSEKDFYEPKTSLGRKMNYKFRLSDCFDSCLTCSELSSDENDQKCLKCREGFYFKEGTNNCYDKIETKYYFDEDTQRFSPCYKDCLTCSYKPLSEKEMNCLTCDYDLKYYNRSKNCLNCSKYVNYEQNECIDTIPDGYYLEDKELGSLGKCYYLCKTCLAGPYYKGNYLHMNCKTCLYKNSQYKPSFDGDCPDTPEEEGDDTPVDGKCSFNKPILKDGKCQSIYCTAEEYESSICTIYNPIVKTQWLNVFHTFSEESTSSVCLAEDIISNEKIIFLAQSQEMGYTDKYLYGFYNNGSGIFYDKNENVFNTYKKLTYPPPQKLIENLAYIELDTNGYLLTTPIENNLNLINYDTEEKEVKRIDPSAYSTDKIILKQEKTLSTNREYLTDYIYCKNNDNKQCYMMMKNFEENGQQLIEINTLISSVQVYNNSNLKCFKDYNNYIKCTYNKVNEDSTISHVIGIFSAFPNKDILFVKEFELETNYDINPSFDSMIELSDDSYFIGYSLRDNKNAIKIIFKKIFNEINVFRMSDYISNIPSIVINEDSLYNFAQGEAKKNSLYKITSEKFAMMVNNYRDNKNSGIVIFIFTFYNSFSQINVRHYPISFKLYNTLIDGKLLGYNLNGFFGALIELTSDDNNDLKRASFFTFGYKNSTSDISPMEGYDILFKKQEKIEVNNYFTEIENNLFGYKYVHIKVVSVPNENKAGYFSLINQQYGRLNKNDTIGINSKLDFYKCENPIKGNYTLVLAPMIEEPNYQEMNSLCQKLESYPLDQNDTENKFYVQKTYLGKQFSFNFYLEGEEDVICYDNCQTCSESSTDKNDQKCIECKENFYKIYETNNCFDKIDGYYLDKDKKVFMPCYEQCLTCDNNGNNTRMNCLSCKDNFKLYEKSTNCLNCEKYVNYLQTECISEVPEGYYVENENLGTLGKCHELCKTCEKGEAMIDGELHMNCKVCKYNNSKFNTSIEGNCPDTQGEDEKEDDKKEDDKKEDDKKEDGQKEEKAEEGTSSYIWILYVSIIIVVVIVAIILIRFFCLSHKRNKIEDNNYNKMENKGQNISMEDQIDLGVL